MTDKKIKFSWKPTSEFRFFIYDPCGDGFIFYKSAEDRDYVASEVISMYLDDGWNEDVEQIVAGEISHTCEQTNREERPDDVDEEGYDEDGGYWGDFDHKCNYELVELEKKSED